MWPVLTVSLRWFSEDRKKRNIFPLCDLTAYAQWWRSTLKLGKWGSKENAIWSLSPPLDNYISPVISLVEPWWRAIKILLLLVSCLACRAPRGVVCSIVPALGNTMQMERAALLSAPCSHLAWLGFFEGFLTASLGEQHPICWCWGALHGPFFQGSVEQWSRPCH